MQAKGKTCFCVNNMYLVYPMKHKKPCTKAINNEILPWNINTTPKYNPKIHLCNTWWWYTKCTPTPPLWRNYIVSPSVRVNYHYKPYSVNLQHANPHKHWNPEASEQMTPADCKPVGMTQYASRKTEDWSKT